MKKLSAVELKQKLDTGEKPVLLDVREAWEFATCHIEGSININMANVQQMINELEKEDETVVICHHGMRSFQVANYLEASGYVNIINLEGGVDAWARTVDENMPQY